MSIVLVVDDEFGIADLIDAVLTDAGHTVLTAANGRQALETLATEHADLVFLDFMMPVLDGAATLNRMANDPVLQAIPVVLMSSMPEAMVAERCFGYAIFMRKPFRIAEVISIVARLLARGSPEG